MKYTKTTNTARMLSIILLSALCACSGEKYSRHAEKKDKKEKKMAKQEEQSGKNSGVGGKSNGDVSQFAATGCDASLWNHVYDPTRLEKVAACVTVSGIVEESAPDDDGDQHFLLKLDVGQDALINKKNQKKKNGDLVVEIVCANPISLPKAKPACAGYKNGIPLPKVGARLRATGTYVIDSNNGWAEIHPVSKLQGM